MAHPPPEERDDEREDDLPGAGYGAAPRAGDRRAREPSPAGTRPRVAVLSHDRSPATTLAGALRDAGFEVQVAGSLAASRRLLDAADSDAIVIAPLALEAGGVEFELLESAQTGPRPVPVLLLLPDVAAVDHVLQHRLPLCDFALPPHRPAECVRRVQLALRHVSRLESLQRHADELQSQVSIDFKTGLLSERHFRHVLAVEFKRARRHRTPLSLLYLDIDDFKGINDSTEYAFGDEVLRAVAALLRNNLRETDFAARFGGDEFNALLPHTTPAEAVQTAMRIRSRIARTVVRSERFARSVTVSIGIDSFDGCVDLAPEDLRRRANLALQRSKRRGKNKVWLYADDMEAADPTTPTARRSLAEGEGATGTG